jgi:hypothetical protein
MNYLFKRQHKVEEEWASMFRCVLILIKIYSDAEEYFPQDLKCVYPVIKTLLMEWENTANRIETKPDTVWTVVVKGLAGGDMVNLISELIEVAMKKENIEEIVKSDLVRVLLESVMVDRIYPVYVNVPNIQWNGGIFIQKV